jgi:FkbH-like protein
MVLSGDDITTWRVNWEPKPENIASIITELNIGADSVVFVDDSPTEALEVESRIDAVRALLVPEELADLPSLLASSGLFRGLRASEEDRIRTEMMRTEATRRRAAETTDRDGFLASLELRVSFGAVTESDIARVAQLTQKTNQFNLTTIRRDEREVRDLIAAPAAHVYAIRVSDRFGDYGLVGVAVVDVGAVWTVESLLLSCRVLGRGVETAFLAAIVDAARAGGANAVAGRFVPTRKNEQVADFYPRHSFAPRDEPGTFALELASTTVPNPAHIELVR